MIVAKAHFAAALLLAAGTCVGSPAAEVACGENALRLYAKPLAYEVMRGGKTLVPKTGIGICIDGKWLGDGALPRDFAGAEPNVVEADEPFRVNPI